MNNHTEKPKDNVLAKPNARSSAVLAHGGPNSSWGISVGITALLLIASFVAFSISSNRYLIQTESDLDQARASLIEKVQSRFGTFSQILSHTAARFSDSSAVDSQSLGEYLQQTEAF